MLKARDIVAKASVLSKVQRNFLRLVVQAILCCREFVIRDGKGFTGLTYAQTRNLNGIDTHLNMSRLTLGLTKAEHYHSVRLESNKPLSINAVKTRAFNEHFARRVLSIYRLSSAMIENHPEFQNIRNYAIIQT
jgi:hypothetical protein